MMGLPNPTCNARITVGVDVSTNWRRRSTRACKRCKVSSANGLTNRLRSGCWCSTPSERRQHFGVQAVGLGQSTHGTGEVAGLARCVLFCAGPATWLDTPRSGLQGRYQLLQDCSGHEQRIALGVYAIVRGYTCKIFTIYDSVLKVRLTCLSMLRGLPGA